MKFIIMLFTLFLGNLVACENDKISQYLNYKVENDKCVKVSFKEKKEVLIGIKNNDKIVLDFTGVKSTTGVVIEDEKGTILYYQSKPYNYNCLDN